MAAKNPIWPPPERDSAIAFEPGEIKKPGLGIYSSVGVRRFIGLK